MPSRSEIGHQAERVVEREILVELQPRGRPQRGHSPRAPVQCRQPGRDGRIVEHACRPRAGEAAPPVRDARAACRAGWAVRPAPARPPPAAAPSSQAARPTCAHRRIDRVLRLHRAAARRARRRRCRGKPAKARAVALAAGPLRRRRRASGRDARAIRGRGPRHQPATVGRSWVLVIADRIRRSSGEGA